MFDLSTITPLVFSVLSVGLFVAVAVLAFQKKVAAAFSLVVAASLAGVFGQIDRVSEVSAGLQSLTIKLREANDVLTSLRKLAVLTGHTLLALEDNAGLLGGNPSDRKDRLRLDVQNLFQQIGVSKNDEALLNFQIRSAVLNDYLLSLGDAEYRMLSNNRSDLVSVRSDVVALWHDDQPPAPGPLETVLNKHFPENEFIHRFETDYRAYYETSKHLDDAFWRGRDYWPAIGP